MKKYFNYHRHTYSSNVTTIDCTVSNEDYANRAMELGHEWISSCEHGGTINWVDAYMVAQKKKLKYVHVGEYYFVPCRHSEEEKVVELQESYFMGYSEKGTRTVVAKDKSNYHLILVAKTKKAFEELNYIMSEANMTGYYYKPRIDLELLRGLPKGEVYCTTACLGGFLRDYPKNKWLLEELIDIFGENFYLEVQPHPSNKQIEYNELIKEIAKEYHLKIIGACDSHMIDEKGKIDRNYLLHSKKIIYDDEEGWYLDYPDYDTLFQRFMGQGIWTENEVHELLDNTLQLTQVEQFYLDPKMKVPTIFPEKDREWKLGYLKKLIFEKWEKYKGKVPKARWKKYKKEILLEYSIIERTKMEDYFISNYHIINRGIELGGLLTRSSRGSGASFFINMLLGFTTIDRLKSKLPMLPQRFMSISRIIEENSSPDIDFNIYNREYFLQAQDELFGENANFFMVAYGTLGVKSAFKMLCRAKDIEIEVADEISKLITSWENDKKHNEDADIMDYIEDPYHVQLIKESEKYNGIIDSMSAHPCFVAGTKVLTLEGYKNIDDIKIGDYVQTHTGNYEKVYNTMINKEHEKIIDIYSGSQFISSTTNHPHLVYDGKDIKWLSANEIKVGMYLCQNIEKGNKIPKWDNIIPKKNGRASNKISYLLDKEYFWKFIGRIVGDDWAQNSIDEKRTTTILCSSHEEYDEIMDILKHIPYKYTLEKCRTTYKYRFYTKELFLFIKQFGYKAHDKFIPNFMFDLPTNLIQSFLDGYISADGHIYESGLISICSASENLLLGVQKLVNKVMQVKSHIRKREREGKSIIEGREVYVRDCFSLTILTGRDSFIPKYKNYSFVKDGYLLNKITKIQDNIDQLQPVYNISVENDESYTANNFVTHNCATILSNTDIRRAFGVLKSPNGVLVANITGKQSEKMGYLKNDFLIVDVVDLNDKLYKRVGMEYIGAEDLYEEIEKHDGIWDLFANGYTLCLNQMESSGTTQKMMRYKPRGLYELSNSVGAIRPGFASNYQMYEKRENFQYGIPFIDKILQGEFIEGSYLLYQEQQMKLLELIGIEPDRIVATIKAISKKNIDVIESIGADFNRKMFDMAVANGETDEDKVRDVISRLWRVFVDSAKYMFNTPHAQATATDCLHSALIKYLYPIEFYEVVLEKYSSAKDTQKVALLKNEAYRYKGITVKPMRYGQNNTKFTANPETNEIYQSLLSVKAINKNTAEVIYELGKEYKPDNFFDLYLKMKEIGLSKTHIGNLIKIGYFDNIEPVKRKCLWLCDNFDKYNKKQLKKDKIDELWKDFNLSVSIIDFYNSLKLLAVKETPKQLAYNEGDLIKYLYSIINIQDNDKLEEMYWECELLGTIIDDVDETFMLGRVGKWNPSTSKIVFKHIKTNSEQWIKVNCSTHLKEKDYIFIDKVSSKIYRGREYFTAESIINLSEKYKKVVDKK